MIALAEVEKNIKIAAAKITKNKKSNNYYITFLITLIYFDSSFI